jgi:phospholipid/cholesterol/gamma-HCH transport system substrate-binding protein
MAQRKQLTWAELRVGLFVLVALFVLAVGIFYVTAPGFVGPKYRLKTYLPEVSQLAGGAPVRIDGVEVGNVETIRLVPRTQGQVADKNRNIEVVMRIDRRYQNYILSDSVASLVTEGLLGTRYVNITRGVTGVPKKEGEEITGTEEKAIKEVVERSAELLGNLQALSTEAQDLIAAVKQGRGTLGKLINDPQAYNHLNSILAKSDQLVTDVQAGHGTIGKLVTSDELYNKVNNVATDVSTITSDLRAQKGTLGKLLYDPTLYDEAKKAISSGNTIVSDVRAGKGTFGKLLVDEELYNKLRDTSTNLSNATAKLNENTTTAGKLFSDPKLYDNLAGLTGDLRLLVGDFRQNPKKFLHFKVTVF